MPWCAGVAGHSFFVEPDSVQGDRAELRGQVAHQIARVLRLQPGDLVYLLDNSGYRYSASLVSVSKSGVTAEVSGRERLDTEPGVELVLCQALLKGQKLEWVLQKGTEIGVSRFVPVLSERCVSRPSKVEVDRKLERWREIVREAAEQSGRALLPQVKSLVSFEEACHEAGQAALAAMAWEEERSLGMGTLLKEAGIFAASGERHGVRPMVLLLVGPEGGFSERESEVARSAGVKVVSLGPRILRAETAALVVATVVLCKMGELDG